MEWAFLQVSSHVLKIRGPLECKTLFSTLDLYFNKNVYSERVFITVRKRLFNLTDFIPSPSFSSPQD